MIFKSLSVIFPLLNEEKRLTYAFNDIQKFNKKKLAKKLEYIFVDDGSTDNSFKIIKEFISKNSSKNIRYKSIKLKKNFGKGYALKIGVKNSSYEWILTIDTDISVSLLELLYWKKKNYIKNHQDNLIYFGSRSMKNSKINYKFYRKFLGFIFSSLVRLLFNTELKDTQCGFKLYKSNIAKNIFSKIQSHRFTHDVEILNLAKKFEIEIQETPVNWSHKKNSKLNIIFDSFKMFIDLIDIKLKIK